MTSPLAIATRGYLDSPGSIATRGYLTSVSAVQYLDLSRTVQTAISGTVDPTELTLASMIGRRWVRISRNTLVPRVTPTEDE